LTGAVATKCLRVMRSDDKRLHEQPGREPRAQVELVRAQQRRYRGGELVARRHHRHASSGEAEALLDDHRIAQRRGMRERILDAIGDGARRHLYAEFRGGGGQQRLVDACRVMARVAHRALDDVDQPRLKHGLDTARGCQYKGEQQPYGHLVARHQHVGRHAVDRLHEQQQPFHRRRRR